MRIGNSSRKVHINAAFGFGIVLEVIVPSGLSLYLSGAPPSDGATILLFLKVLTCVMTSSSRNSWYGEGSGTFVGGPIHPPSELDGFTSVNECASLSFGKRHRWSLLLTQLKRYSACVFLGTYMGAPIRYESKYD